MQGDLMPLEQRPVDRPYRRLGIASVAAAAVLGALALVSAAKKPVEAKFIKADGAFVVKEETGEDNSEKAVQGLGVLLSSLGDQGKGKEGGGMFGALTGGDSEGGQSGNPFSSILTGGGKVDTKDLFKGLSQNISDAVNGKAGSGSGNPFAELAKDKDTKDKLAGVGDLLSQLGKSKGEGSDPDSKGGKALAALGGAFEAFRDDKDNVKANDADGGMSQFGSMVGTLAQGNSDENAFGGSDQANEALGAFGKFLGNSKQDPDSQSGDADAQDAAKKALGNFGGFFR